MGYPMDLKDALEQGWDVFSTDDLDAKEAIKAAPGSIAGWYLLNASDAVQVVKLYDALVADVTVGTTVPKMRLALPAGGAANLILPKPVFKFEVGITIAATEGVADASTTEPGTNEVVANIFFV